MAGRGVSRWAVVTVMLVAWLCSTGAATAQLRVVNYNIAQLNGDLNDLEDVIVAMHADDKNGFAVPVSIFIFQEVRSTDIATLNQIIFDAAPPGVNYSGATYTSGAMEDSSGGAQAMYYNSAMLLEDQSAHLDLPTGGNRATDRWKLDLIGYDSPDACLYIYGSHLKASQGDAAERLAGVETIRGNADLLPLGTHIIYAGDMNFYSSGEAGYQKFVEIAVSGAVDPFGTGPWNGPSSAIKHTQSPRTSTSGGLIGGGLDDRFDFQLATAAFHDGEGLTYIDSTYRSFGNDGNHHDTAINSGSNSYYPDDIPRSNLLANDLHDGSDHIPVIAEYQIPGILFGVLTPSFGTVIEGASVQVTAFLSNNVDVVDPIGGDTVNFIGQGSGAVTGATAGALPPLGPLEPHDFDIDTSTPGPASGTVTVVSTDQGVQNGILVLNTGGDILRVSNPSLDGRSDVDDTLLELAYDADTGIHSIDVDIHNLGFDAIQATLDVDDIVGLAAPFGQSGGLPTGIDDTPGTVSLTFDTNGLADGLYQATATINTSDEDLPGETTHALLVAIDVQVGPGVVCDADCAAGGDGTVDVVDLLDLLSQWGGPGTCDIAPDGGNGVVDVQDLLDLLATWGPC